MGRVIDIVPNRMLIAGLACAVTMAGHLLLGLTTLNPLVGLVTLYGGEQSSEFRVQSLFEPNTANRP